MRRPQLLSLLLPLLLLTIGAWADDGIAHVTVGPGGPSIVSAQIDRSTARGLRAGLCSVVSGRRALPVQLDRLPNGDALVTWQRPSVTARETFRILRRRGGPAVARPVKVTSGRDGVTVDTGVLVVRHDPGQAWLPTWFRVSGERGYHKLSWNDRLYSSSLGPRRFTADTPPKALSTGPLRAEIRISGTYSQPGAATPGNPRATYSFVYTAGSPLVEVNVDITSDSATAWDELHIAELGAPGLSKLYSGVACASSALRGSGEPCYDAAALISTGSECTVGLIQNPRELVHGGDERLALYCPPPSSPGEPSYAGYVRGPWINAWSGAYRRRLWLALGGPSASRSTALGWVSSTVIPVSRRVTTSSIDSALASAEREFASRAQGRRPMDWWWRAYGAAALRRIGDSVYAASADGRLTDALRIARSARAEALRLAGDRPRMTAGSTPGSWAARSAGVIVVGSSRCAVAVRTSGVPGVCSLVRRGGGGDLIDGARVAPLIRIELRRPDGSLLRTDGRVLRAVNCATSIDSAGVLLRIRTLESPAPGIRVSSVMTCRIASCGDETRWRVETTSAGATVSGVRFPDIAASSIGGMDEADFQAAAHPCQVGEQLMDTPATNGDVATEPFTGKVWYYPSLDMGVQMTCLFDRRTGKRGSDMLYFCAEDPECNYKAFQYLRSSGGLHCSFIHYPDGDGAVEYVSTYDTVVAPLSGDWFDAAVRYRKWAVGQPWCRKGPMAARADTPEWIKAPAVWYLAADNDPSMVKSLADNADFLGEPVAAHWYDWHHNRFDSRMPEYFPPAQGVDGFIAHIQEWNRHGIRAVPYVQGVGWDMLSKTFEDEGAGAGVCLDGSMKPVYSTLWSGTPDECHMASMCVASRLWQDKLFGIVRTLAGYGADGVYLDSIGCAATPCYATNHGHAPGQGGHYWADGVRTLMNRLRTIRNSKGAPLAFTTEAFTECGIDVIDSYLPHLQHPRPEDGCLYDAIYHEYTSFHGCAVSGDYAPDGTLPRVAATCLVLGRPIGWFYHGFHNDRLMADGARAEMVFLRDLCRVRTALRPFLGFGRMLPPPELTVVSGPGSPESPVLASAWQSGKRRLVVVVNYSTAPLRVRLDLSRLGSLGKARRVWPRDGGSAQIASGREMRVEARSALAWEY